MRQNPISNSARGSDEKFANAEMQLLDQGGGDDLGIRKETGCLFEEKKKSGLLVCLSLFLPCSSVEIKVRGTTKRNKRNKADDSASHPFFSVEPEVCYKVRLVYIRY